MFGKRYNFLSVFGIKIGIDLSWLFIAILLTWTLAAGYFPFRDPNLPPATYWIMGFVGMLSLFACVTLHELGHALVAKHYKLPISQITLFVFGGVSEIKKEPETPKVEFLMAIAGPLVSIVLGVIMLFITRLGEQQNWPASVTGITGYLMLINFVLAGFNLIPAFPLDGGRVFRSILWGLKHDPAWATKIATRVGYGFGMLLIILGLFGLITGNILAGIWLAIIGLFLQRAASSSQTQFYVGRALRGEKVAKFMKKNPITIPPDISVQEFVDDYVYKSHHHVYPVTDHDTLLGTMSLNEVRMTPRDAWETTTVKKAMMPRSSLHTVTPNTNAADALNTMHEIEPEWPALMVVEGKQLVGMLTAQDLFKVISLKLELESRHHG